MSIEQALIAQATPKFFTAKLRDFIRTEISKGCQSEVSLFPVSLEPNFTPLWAIRNNSVTRNQPHWTEQEPIFHNDLIRLRVWISPEQKFDWNNCELFLKQLLKMSCRTCFEVFGNNEGITISFLIHRLDRPIITAAFEGEFDFCKLTLMTEGRLSDLPKTMWKDIAFQDYFPSPPYSHLLTRPQELQSSPLRSLITAMSAIEKPSVGIYQVLLQAVSPQNNWHRNVQILLDFEYEIKLNDGFHNLSRYSQQAPSGDLKQMAWEVENKAHNDKPFYAMSLRVGVIGAGDKAGALLSSLTTFTSLFQHGGRPLNSINDRQYSNVLSSDQIRDMFFLGVTHRPGFLVNSYELTGPVHIPPLSICEPRQLPLEGLETLPVCNCDLQKGTWIGICSYAGDCQRVCLPGFIRTKHTHLIGGTGVGKSTTVEHMILQDIEQGNGVAVLDPHGDLIERLLGLIPENHKDTAKQN